MPGKMTDIIRLTVSLPLEERDWLRNQAKANLTSINAELVRARLPSADGEGRQ